MRIVLKKIYQIAQHLIAMDLIAILRIRKITTGNCLFLKNTSINYDRSSKIRVEKGSFMINCKWSTNDPFNSLFSIGKNAQLIVKNNFKIYSGSRIYINENATLVLGSGYVNNNLNLSCFERIEIGEEVCISENVCMRDSDNHTILYSDQPVSQPIKIGNHVWIGMNVTILKGVTIGNGAIIAANSLVNRNVPEKTLVAGVPAKVVKSNVEWK